MTESWPRDLADTRAGELSHLDITVPNPARMWNYWLGGKDNFSVDRDMADKVQEALPSVREIARAMRRFLIDAVHRIAADHGVRQFLDIGAGLPTAENTHEVAQRAAPESRIVYADNDPVVLTHARALLLSSPTGATDYIYADLRDTAKIVAEAGRTLDFSQPIAILLIAVLHFIPDHDDPHGITARLMDAVPPGSYLAITHGASDIQAEAIALGARRYNQLSSVPVTTRSRQQVTRFFDGLDLMEPGVVPIDQWPAPSQADAVAARGLAGYCGAGLKR